MKIIRLSGRIPFSDFRTGTKPEHLFLPYPTRVESEFDTTPLYLIEKNQMDISWKATWIGNDLCDRVLKRSKIQLEHHIFIRKIYDKLEPYSGSDPDLRRNLKVLKRLNSKDIKRWNSVVTRINDQLTR